MLTFLAMLMVILGECLGRVHLLLHVGVLTVQNRINLAFLFLCQGVATTVRVHVQ